MNTIARELYDTALQLPDSERAELAARLIESLDTDVDSGVDPAWDTEIKRRIGELDSGEVTAVPWPEARRIILGITDGPSPD
jgi:putative addiction module component (TIGR02574 family)